MRQFEKEKRQFDLDKLEFEKSLELRNFEIKNFWNRAWFFGALMVAIASAYFEAGKPEKELEEYRVYLAFLGFVVSLLQCLMNRGSKYWQERWENKTKNKESKLGIDLTKTKHVNERWLLDAGTLAKNENFFTLPRRFSVTKLTILVWDIITISWAILWIKHLNCSFENDFGWHNFWTFYFPILFYAVLFFFGKRFRTTLKSGEKDRVQLSKWPKWLRWLRGLHLLRFENGGGGKVYEKFVRKEDDNTHGDNVDHRYYADSEYYVKNDQRKLLEIHNQRVAVLFSKYAKELLGNSVEIIHNKYTNVPEFDNLTEDESKREKLKTYWDELDQISKPFS